MRRLLAVLFVMLALLSEKAATPWEVQWSGQSVDAQTARYLMGITNLVAGSGVTFTPISPYLMRISFTGTNSGGVTNFYVLASGVVSNYFTTNNNPIVYASNVVGIIPSGLVTNEFTVTLGLSTNQFIQTSPQIPVLVTNWVDLSVTNRIVFPAAYTNFSAATYLPNSLATPPAVGTASELDISFDSGVTWVNAGMLSPTNGTFRVSAYQPTGTLPITPGISNITVYVQSRPDLLGHTNSVVSQHLEVPAATYGAEAVNLEQMQAAIAILPSLTTPLWMNGHALNLSSTWGEIATNDTVVDELVWMYLGALEMGLVLPSPTYLGTNVNLRITISNTNVTLYIPTNSVASRPFAQVTLDFKTWNALEYYVVSSNTYPVAISTNYQISFTRSNALLNSAYLRVAYGGTNMGTLVISNSVVISGQQTNVVLAPGGYVTADANGKLGVVPAIGSATNATVASYVSGILTNNISGNAATATVTTYVSGTLTNNTTGSAAYVTGTITNNTTGSAAYVTGTLTNNTTGNATTATLASYVNGKTITNFAATQYGYIYRALLTQSGTGPPTATELENTLPASASWTRDGAGIYHITSSGAFPTNKTFVTVANPWLVSPSGIANAHQFTTNTCYIYTENHSGTLSDNLLWNNAFEILVYP